MTLIYKGAAAVFVSLLLILSTHTVHAAQADIDAELAEYIGIFKGNNLQQQRRVIDKLVWAGYQSDGLYDVIAGNLQEMQGAKDKVGKQQAAWLAKALALSGNEKYRPVLEAVANDAKAKKVRKRAELALAQISAYAKWNPVISRGLAAAPAGRLEEARVKNMLAADDPELLRIGAKRVYHGHKNDAELVELAKQRLAREWPAADNGSDQQIDAIAWLIKVMAESGLKASKPLLEQIAQESKSKKVRKYAEKYAAYLR